MRVNIFYLKTYPRLITKKCLKNTSKNNNFCGSCIKTIRDASKCLKCNVICWSPVRDIYNGYNYSVYCHWNYNIIYNDICCNNHRICIKNNIIKNILPIMAIVLKKIQFLTLVLLFLKCCVQKKHFKVYNTKNINTT